MSATNRMDRGKTLFCDRCNLRSGLCTCEDHRQRGNGADSDTIGCHTASEYLIAALRAQIALLRAWQKFPVKRIAALEGKDQ